MQSKAQAYSQQPGTGGVPDESYASGPDQRDSNYQVFSLSGEQWWRILVVSCEQTTIMIGRSPGEGGIALVNSKNAAPLHVCVHHVEGWRFIVQRVIGEPMKVNGIQCLYAVTPVDCPVQLSVGFDHYLIVPNYRLPVSRLATPVAELGTPNGILPLYLGRAVLVGAHELCDIRVKWEDFYGIVSFYQGHLFHLQLAGKIPERKRRESDMTRLVLKDLSFRSPQELVHGNFIDLRSNGMLDLKRMVEHVERRRIRRITCKPGNYSEGPIALWAFKHTDEGVSELNTVTLPKECVQIVVGRDKEADLEVNDGSMSRRHTRIHVDENCLRLEDLGSTNGTFINGEQISDAVAYPGDFINFGDKCFLVAWNTVETYD